MERIKGKINVNDITKDVCCLMKNTAEKKNIQLILEGEELTNSYRR